MSVFKITLLIVAALGRAQEQPLVKHSTFNSMDFSGSVEMTKAALEIIAAQTAKITKVVDEVTVNITAGINKARAVQAQVKAQAQATINDIVANGIAQGEKQNGSQACLTETVRKLEGLGLQTMLDITDCLGKKVTELVDMLQIVVNASNSALTMGPDAITQINQCHITGGFSELLCTATVVIQFVEKANSVVTDITLVAAKAMWIVGSVEAELTVCASLQFVKMTAQTVVLLAELSLCSSTPTGQISSS